jgi:ribosomal protein S3
MGQKIHPFGFRVGITKRHQTTWFARFQKHQYAQTVLEDIFLRKTLQKLLPELLKKKYNSSDQMAKIAHIKIERGFIPYEIGIQIHAQNCEAVKMAVDKLEIDSNVLQNVLKNQFVLEKAAFKSKDLFQMKNTENGESSLQQASSLNKKGLSKTKSENTSMFQRKSIKENLFDKRVKKRQNTLERFRQRILENIVIIKKGKKITRKLQKSDLKAFSVSRQGNDFGQGKQKRGQNTFRNRTQKNSVNSRFAGTSRNNPKNIQQNQSDLSNLSTARLRSMLSENREQSQKTTKFMNIFLNKMNRNFLTSLKSELTYWNTYLENYKQKQIQEFGQLRYAPLGYSSKWSLNRLKRFEKQSLSVLIKLLKVLQKQALRKLELLRKEFFVVGTLPKMKSFVYYQRIRFIKGLKTFIQQAKAEMLFKQKSKLGSSNQWIGSKNNNVYKQLENQKVLLGFKEKALKQKLTNIQNETRKIRLVEYLQSIVQKHRQKNLYLYLATIADSRKYLRQIQKFTKQQANFLFGLNPSILEQMPQEQKHEFVKNQLKKAIQKANRQNEFQRNLQEVFVRQIQQQKFIAEKNLALLPKISLKFYSVKAETLETNASIVTDSIVDKLEKREAFRKVIKKVSEDLMKTSKVKGVKIQVSGRLNGAEIARSEWVRAGRVPLQTLRANIDYCYKTAQTIYGIIGVKVWIYRGYTQRNKNA